VVEGSLSNIEASSNAEVLESQPGLNFYGPVVSRYA
jgi:hypothetical protein